MRRGTIADQESSRHETATDHLEQLGALAGLHAAMGIGGA